MVGDENTECWIRLRQPALYGHDDLRLVAWNIRAGGGVRADAIARQIIRWRPDVVNLSEFRATPPSVQIADRLAEAGLCYQRTTADPRNPAVNALLVASRWPLRRLVLRDAPDDARRWLPVRVAAPQPIAVLGVHVPNRVTGRKPAFLNAAAAVLSRWRGPPAVLMGDTNSGRIGLDEQASAFNKMEDDWLERLDAMGWPDAFRAQHGLKRAYTWYSPNGRNGFRLDQMFLHRKIQSRATRFQYIWAAPRGARRDTLSDHAAMLLDLDH